MNKEIPQDLTYEKALEMLNSILKKVEDGSVPIDQLEANIDSANDLVTYCQDRLHAIRGKLEEKHGLKE